MRCSAASLVFWFVFSASVWSTAADQPATTHFSNLPVGAQSSISAAVGRDDAAYAMRRQGEGFHAGSPRGGLAADFTSGGVKLRASRTQWRMAFVGYGYGEALRSSAPVAPQAKLNRVEYRRGELTEWYVNGPGGLEQGFTLAAAPGKSNGQPLTIALAVSGNLRGTVQKDGHELKLEGIGGNDLRYAGLSAFDATGKELRAWLEWSGSELRLKIQDTQAHYPVVIDPWMQLAELTASDGQGGDHFGFVTIHGDTIVVGAPLATVWGQHSAGRSLRFRQAEDRVDQPDRHSQADRFGWTGVRRLRSLSWDERRGRYGWSVGS
jgi:trimeric autotransporter adhesin